MNHLNVQDLQFNFFLIFYISSIFIKHSWCNLIKFLLFNLRKYKRVRKDQQIKIHVLNIKSKYLTDISLGNWYYERRFLFDYHIYATLIVCKLPSLIHNPIFFFGYLLVINTWKRHEARNTIPNDPDNRREKGVEPDANNRFADASWLSGIPTKLEND